VHDRLDPLVEELARVLRAGDHVLVMSNGAFGAIHDKLITRLAARREPATR
jgi:UDP-N-acetylmuramate: L-alanyl-gamma-D-glutamyl-meso-diaminopimelate ligase